jgi:rhodanese-related sulfurtransferase
MKTLTKEELKKIIDDDEDFELVNVLGKEAFEKAHILGSKNIPVDDERFEQKFSEIADKDTKIVVYCASFDCEASPKAAEKLEKSGYTNVYDYEGGMKDWKEAGYPVESGE